MNRRWAIVLLALLLAALAAAGFWADALAQDAGGYDCEVIVAADGAFDARCVPQATAAPATATATPAKTATPTATSTATATSTPAPAAGLRFNAPLINAVRGDAALDANNWAIVSLGRMSPAGGYTQMRVVGANDGVQFYVQTMTPNAGGSFTLRLNGATQIVTYKSTPGWTFSQRCGAAPGSCRGWTAERFMAWSELSGGDNAAAYSVTCHVVTAAGREDDRTITVAVQER